MKTKVILTKSGTQTFLYYINVYTIDSLGFQVAQYSTWISEEQYFILKMGKEEKFQNGLYYVDLI